MLPSRQPSADVEESHFSTVIRIVFLLFTLYPLFLPNSSSHNHWEVLGYCTYPFFFTKMKSDAGSFKTMCIARTVIGFLSGLTPMTTDPGTYLPSTITSNTSPISTCDGGRNRTLPSLFTHIHVPG